jgi:hypothetical protein
MDTAAILAQARSHFQQSLVTCGGQIVGSVAALAPEAATAGFHDDLNYGEVFLRDNVPVMMYLLLSGRGAVVRHFLNTCLALQQTDGLNRGLFPTSFVEKDGKLVADYGQRAIGRVCSPDASLWLPILAQQYVQHTGDRTWANQDALQIGLQRLLDLVMAPRFRAAPILEVPDGAFMIDRPLDVWGAPLEIQVLLYGALRATAELWQGAESVKQQVLDRAAALKTYLQTHYWVSTPVIQDWRRRGTEQYGDPVANPFNLYPETIPDWLQSWLGTDGGYLIGNLRSGRPDFRFFSLGNALALCFGLLAPDQQTGLCHLIAQNQATLIGQMPLRIAHPPLTGEAWRLLTGADPKNRPGCYHNGGHWPCLVWFLAAGVMRSQPNLSLDLSQQMRQILHTGYQQMLHRLPQQAWAEYFDGPTGGWVGQQSRDYQTWTVVGLLILADLLAPQATPTAKTLLAI